MNISYTPSFLSTPSPDDLHRLEQLYADNFPSAERKPFEIIAEGIQSNRYVVFVLNELETTLGQSHIVAFAFLLKLSTIPALFLEYMAVDQQFHDKGLGTLLFREFVEALNSEGQIHSIVWEVEPTVTDDPSDNRVRRIKFYERLGGIIVTQSDMYCMPDYEHGSDENGGAVPLRLMWKPLLVSREQPTLSEIIAFVN